ncbi:hypothetical protein ANN_09420 [Periplaneta americana]|uniref:Uncharacterized protein n=1 Tax=Periplaneta americana TaxID=6978 RepID=A0ABQ8TM95_PERAM|nr:hypothetical protein ANN_09420 [Periplaneta americana]
MWFRSRVVINKLCSLCGQELHGDDTDMRVQFCEWFLERRTHQPNVEADICWSDEACFHLNGTVNRHNAVYWTTENPT